MNPLNSGHFGNFKNMPFNQPDPHTALLNNVKHVKSLMKMSQGDPTALVQQFPKLKPILQMAQGQNLEAMYMSLCRERGIDPNVILNELRN